LPLISSPQRLIDSESWTKQLPVSSVRRCCNWCVSTKPMPKFFKLKDILVDTMQNSAIPVVFRTATATEDMIGHKKQLSGLDILPEILHGLGLRVSSAETLWLRCVGRYKSFGNLKTLPAIFWDRPSSPTALCMPVPKHNPRNWRPRLRDVSMKRGFLATSSMPTATSSTSAKIPQCHAIPSAWQDWQPQGYSQPLRSTHLGCYSDCATTLGC
jgi:hypothetical protein